MDFLFGQTIVPGHIVPVGAFSGLAGQNIDGCVSRHVVQFFHGQCAELRFPERASHHRQKRFLRAFFRDVPNGGFICFKGLLLHAVELVEPGSRDDGITFRKEPFLEGNDVPAVHMSGPGPAFDGTAGTRSEEGDRFDPFPERERPVPVLQQHDAFFRQLFGKSRILLFQFCHLIHHRIPLIKSIARSGQPSASVPLPRPKPCPAFSTSSSRHGTSICSRAAFIRLALIGRTVVSSFAWT